jgi:hypothetical protein
MAEAYWDLEWELMQQGFDFCYDKKLYDRMGHDGAESVRGHLCADIAYQNKLVRFLENHDEPHAAATFTPERGRVAAIAVATLPGALLLHEGQFEGRKIRLPVFLGRRPVNQEIFSFYKKLLGIVREAQMRKGEWKLCETHGWPGNTNCKNLIAWCWNKSRKRHVIVVNFSDAPAQGRIRIPWEDMRGKKLKLDDLLSGNTYDRSGDEIQNEGLYVDLAGWGYHLFRI